MIQGSCHCGAVQWRFEAVPESVNVRLTEPEAVAHLPIDHFDGLGRFEDLPRNGRCAADYWF